MYHVLPAVHSSIDKFDNDLAPQGGVRNALLCCEFCSSYALCVQAFFSFQWNIFLNNYLFAFSVSMEHILTAMFSLWCVMQICGSCLCDGFIRAFEMAGQRDLIMQN